MKRRSLIKAGLAAVASLFAVRAATPTVPLPKIGASTSRTSDDRPTLIIEIPVGSPGDEVDAEIEWLQFVQVKGSPSGVLKMRVRTRPYLRGDTPMVAWEELPVNRVSVIGHATKASGGSVVVDDSTYPAFEDFTPVWKGEA